LLFILAVLSATAQTKYIELLNNFLSVAGLPRINFPPTFEETMLGAVEAVTHPNLKCSSQNWTWTDPSEGDNLNSRLSASLLREGGPTTEESWVLWDTFADGARFNETLPNYYACRYSYRNATDY
jgi:hypothetical protein